MTHSTAHAAIYCMEMSAIMLKVDLQYGYCTRWMAPCFNGLLSDFSQFVVRFYSRVSVVSMIHWSARWTKGYQKQTGSKFWAAKRNIHLRM